MKFGGTLFTDRLDGNGSRFICNITLHYYTWMSVDVTPSPHRRRQLKKYARDISTSYWRPTYRKSRYPSRSVPVASGVWRFRIVCKLCPPLCVLWPVRQDFWTTRTNRTRDPTTTTTKKNSDVWNITLSFPAAKQRIIILWFQHININKLILI